MLFPVDDVDVKGAFGLFFYGDELVFLGVFLGELLPAAFTKGSFDGSFGFL
jgi:hypothetical protein